MNAMGAPRVFIGMGVTFIWAKETYCGTVSRVSDDATVLWFRQDRRVRRGFGPAFLFVEDLEAPEFEARLAGNQYVLSVEGHRRPIELGIRRWYSTPVVFEPPERRADQSARSRAPQQED